MSKERNVKLQVKCIMCNQMNYLMVTEDSIDEFFSPNRRHVQDIFPYLNPEERELLISHTCPKCWNNMFGGEEE